jgi:hypothetical protein
MEGPAPITIGFVDGVRTVTADDPEGLVFGRGAALDIDSNPFLHRQVGRVVPIGAVWWVENLSASSPVWLTTVRGTHLLAGGAKEALDSTDCTVSFEAGTCRYELHLRLSELPAAAAPRELAADQTLTRRRPDLRLTAEERLLVAALAEPYLRNVPSSSLPTNKEIARRLGWSTPKFNRKLDYLCLRLDRQGVAGVRAPGRRARDRRLRVVEHAIAQRLVSTDDLALLDAYPCTAEGEDHG